MKTIAITIFGTRVSTRLDCAESVLLVTVDDSTVKKREQVRLVQTNPLEKINMLMQLGVEVVICGGITEICFNKFNDCGMQVIPWIRGEAEEVLSQFLAGKLAKTNSLH
jgi:predicted Fe-Mo cluster-binding NifX family protein